ncbi:Uncharacterised protein [Vibrio cholerae]|nr:Uncharacterised protein [Vibrio cholerae]
MVNTATVIKSSSKVKPRCISQNPLQTVRG